MRHTLGASHATRPPQQHGDFYTDGYIIVRLSVLQKRLPLPARRALDAGTVTEARTPFIREYLHNAALDVTGVCAAEGPLHVMRLDPKAEHYRLRCGASTALIAAHYHEPLVEAGLHPCLSRTTFADHAKLLPVVVYCDASGWAVAVVAPCRPE